MLFLEPVGMYDHVDLNRSAAAVAVAVAAGHDAHTVATGAAGALAGAGADYAGSR